MSDMRAWCYLYARECEGKADCSNPPAPEVCPLDEINPPAEIDPETPPPGGPLG